MSKRPEKYITISSKFKLYAYPFIFSIIAVILIFAPALFLNNDLGNVVVVAYILFFVLCIALPAYCITYAKRVLKKEIHGLALTLYNSAIITLFYLLPLCMEEETYLYSLILFIWCELWTLLPLLIFKKQIKTSKTND